MKTRYYFIILLTTVLSYTYNVYGQDVSEDSLEQTILKSLPGFNGNTFSNDFIDSLKMPSSAHAYLKNFLQNINKEIQDAKSAGDIKSLGKSYLHLSTIDSMQGNYKNAYENFKLYSLYRDSLQKKDIEKKELQAKMQRELDKQQTQQQLDKEKEERKNTVRLILLLAILLAVVIISIISFIAYKREQKAKKIVNAQKTELETTLSELQSTQSQLIQSEKMASLGELTAGIAHEIQNPLNFVNNFSEVNKEMIAELKEEIEKGNYDEVKIIATDIETNEEKINHHGKRADAIVKGMLQHSRKSSGQKEPTDINALCDEYLRLSYHGLRAKDKTFNADFKTDFDDTITKINVVPQDFGRVLLNLLNNAFYAVNNKLTAYRSALPGNYKPLVSVQTKKIDNNVEITVTDNGSGIPQNVIDKIFQPFFTTKPTGQGTGLGLSLAYDIVTKEHEGTITAQSKEGEGTTFIIQLPLG